MIGSTARAVAAHGFGHARVIDGIRFNVRRRTPSRVAAMPASVQI
jgi:hypothetical protein